MGRILQLIKNHKWAVFFAIIVAIITAAPQIYFPIQHGESYQGMFWTCTDNEDAYLSRIREVQDGYASQSSVPFNYGKDSPYLEPPLSEILVAYLGKVFFLDINGTILLARLVFAFIGFIVVYGFALLLSKEKLTAISASIVLFLANSLFSRTGLIALLQGESPGALFINFFRPIYPQVSLCFFFAFLFFFWLFFEKKQWRWGIISSFILGLSFYIYPFNWTFLYVFCGVLLFIFFLKKQWPDLKRIALLVLGSILVAIPYFLNFYNALLHPNFGEVSLRWGLIDSRQPLLGFLVPGLFIIFLLFFPKKWKERYIFSLALLLTPFIVLNQQLITGKMMEFGHYHWYINQPIAIVFLIIILFYWAKIIHDKYQFLRKINLVKILAISMIGIGLYTGIIIQKVSYQACEAEILSEQRYAPVVQWLNTNAGKDEVVLADKRSSAFISIYTSLNLFDGPQGYYYISASQEKMLDSLFLFYRLAGLKSEDAKVIFLSGKERGYISRGAFGEYYKEKMGGEENIPDEILLDFAGKYQDFLLIPLDRFLKINDIKYIVWDRKNYPQWQLGQYQFLKSVYEKDDFTIYLLKL